MATSYPSVCRACLAENAASKSLFSSEQVHKQSMVLCDMFMACATLLINKADGLPEHICDKCFDELIRAFSFRKMCESSDVVLRSRLIEIENFQDTCATQCEDYNAITNQLDSGNKEETFHNNVTDIGNFGQEHSSESSNDAVSNGQQMSILGNPNPSQQTRKSYTCEECNETFLGLSSYWKHMSQFHDKVISCDICQKKFKSEKTLEQHKQSEHDERTGETRKSKRSQNKTGITKKRNLPRTCDICNKTFRFHSNLERHKLIHTGEKPYLCNVCGKGFGQMSYLKIHSFIHTGEKPYKCQMCDRSFAAPGTLMTHVRIHTGERPHVCKICGKDFPQSGYLAAHIRTHTGEKPMECKVCHRRFNQSGRLVIHMRIHSGEKPYSCTECGQSFAVKGTLKKHIRTHTGERPYVCTVCGQAFAQSGTLATHMKVHRPKPALS